MHTVNFSQCHGTFTGSFCLRDAYAHCTVHSMYEALYFAVCSPHKELDAEREKKETKRKNAAKKRDKRKEKKRVQREQKEQVAPEEDDEDDLMDEPVYNGEAGSPPSPPCLQPAQGKSETKKSRKKNRSGKKRSGDTADRQQVAAAEDEEEGEEEESQEEEIFMDASDLPPGERGERKATSGKHLEGFTWGGIFR